MPRLERPRLRALAAAALLSVASGRVAAPELAWGRDGAKFNAGGEAIKGAPTRAAADRLLSLEQEEVAGLPAQAVHDSQKEAWWGASAAGSAAELGRMGDLMRRQLAPSVYSYSMFYSYSETVPPSALPTPLPSPLPTAMPTTLLSKTNAPTGVPTPACAAGESLYKLALYDYGDDGWEGAAYTITSNAGTVVASGTMATGKEHVDAMCIVDGTYVVKFGGGADDDEVSVQFLPSDTQFLSTCTAPCEFSVMMIGGEVTEATLAPTTATRAPTTSDANQASFLVSEIFVSGLTKTVFDTNEVLVLKNSLVDVISVATVVADVITVEGRLIATGARRLSETDSVAAAERDARRRLEDFSATAKIGYKIALDTAASNGYASNEEALQAMIMEVDNNAATGYLSERINHWADFYSVTTFDATTVDETGTTPVSDTDPDVTYWALQGAPTRAPTTEGGAGVDLTPTVAPTMATTAAPTMAPTAPTSTTTATPTMAPTAPTSTTTTATPTMAPTAPTSTTTTAAPTAAPTAATTPAPTVSSVAAASSSKKKNDDDITVAETNTILIAVFLVFLALVLLCLFYVYLRNRERKLTERKDSWDISTMFTDEANLPDAEEMIDVEPEGEPPADPEETVAGAALIEGNDQLVAMDEDHPQALQKITQAAEL